MPIVSFNTLNTGQEGIAPRRVTMFSTDDYTHISQPGYISSEQQELMQLQLSDEITMYFDYNPNTKFGNLAIFNPFIVNGLITLVPTAIRPLVGITPVWNGGGTTHAFTVEGINAAYILVVSMFFCTNNVALSFVNCGTENLITAQFTGDPGAGTQLAYIAYPGPLNNF